ncbi:MAG: DNA polymerase III subunit delta [Elusimicrobia bacterium]|nr:DNA polymerase III subunit delta [Elusimicrobiota bacterium]
MASFGKGNTENLASLKAQWAKGVFHPVYLFAGPDAFQKEEAVKILENHFLPGDTSGLNVDRFDGDTSSAGDILNAAQTMALLGGKRLVLVRRAQELTTAETNRLADGMASLAGGNCLVLLWDEKADSRSVLVQSVKAAGVVLTFWVPFEDQLPRWIIERAQTHGKSLSTDTARALLDSIGPNLQDLSQEVEKLALYVKDRKTIEASDVGAMRPDTKTLQFMEWDRALWRRDRAKALALMDVLRAQGQPPESLLSQMVRAYRKLFLGKSLLAEKKVGRMELWDRVWIRTRQPQEDFLEAVSEHSWDDLLRIMENLLQAEWDLKRGRMNPEIGLTILVNRLTQKQ